MIARGLAAGALVLAAWIGHAAAQGGGAPALDLRGAVTLALERNLDLSIQRLAPLIARQQAREARGAFDPIVGGAVTYARTERFLNSVLEAQAESGIVQDNTLTIEYPSLTGRLPTGTQYYLGLVTPVISSNNPLRLYDQSHQAVLTLGVTQPLLRDFGVELNTVRIRQAENAEAQGDRSVEARMLAVIRDVETRYWAVFYAREHLESAQGGVALAEDLVERLTRARGAGLATDLDVLEARTALEGRRADLERARADLRVAEVQLRLAVDPARGATETIEVVGRPRDEGPPQDLWGRLARALAVRPEIRQQELSIERLILDERLARNNAQWRLDAVGSLGWNGLSGDGLNPTFRGPLPSRLQGQDTYTDAFNRFFSPDGNVNWSLGLRFQLPLGNNEALARLEQVRLLRRQEELRLLLLRGQVTAEVESLFQDMAAQASRRAAAREAVALVERQLEAVERDRAAGRATVRRLLEAQDALARARDREAAALADYATVRSRLDAATAASFDVYGLSVQR
jgi:outer membrane protein TolC